MTKIKILLSYILSVACFVAAFHIMCAPGLQGLLIALLFVAGTVIVGKEYK